MFGRKKKNKNTEERTYTEYSIVDWYQNFYTKTGATLTLKDAIKNPTVLGATKLISYSIGSLPLKVYDNKTKKILINEGIYKLFKRPHPEIVPVVLMTTVVRNLVQYGNGYLYVNRDSNFTPTELLPIMSRYTEVKVNNNLRKEFIYRINGKKHNYTSDNVIHFVGFSENGFTGISQLEDGKEAIALSNALEKYASMKFKNGINSRLVLKIPNDLLKKYENNPEEGRLWITKLEKKISNIYAGIENVHKPIILDDGIEIQELAGSDNDKSQLLELRQFQNREIAKLFNVPLHLINDLEKSSFNNIAQQGQEFLEYCLRPWIEIIESTLNTYLIPIYDQERVKIEFDLSAFLRADPAGRSEYYKNLAYISALSVNEIREKENLPLLDKDIMYQPVNMINIFDEKQLEKLQSADINDLNKKVEEKDEK